MIHMCGGHRTTCRNCHPRDGNRVHWLSGKHFYAQPSMSLALFLFERELTWNSLPDQVGLELEIIFLLQSPLSADIMGMSARPS